MKRTRIIFALCLIGVVATVEGSGPCSVALRGGDGSLDVVITLDKIRDFTVSGASWVHGMDWVDGTDEFAAVDNGDDRVNGVDCTSESVSWSTPIDYPAGQLWNFGIAMDQSTAGAFYLNTWYNDELHYWSGSGWSVLPFANPAGDTGKGMSSEPGSSCIWETGDGCVYRIDPGTGNYEQYSTPEVPDEQSGITTYPYYDKIWVIVVKSNETTWYFYEYTGTSLDYIGSAVPEMLVDGSPLGLTYSPSRDTFFWSYYVTSCYIREYSYEILALDHSTWASIKAQF